MRWITALTVAVALAGAGWYVYAAGAASRDAEVAELKLANSNILLGYATAAQQAEEVIRETQTAKTVAVAAADARARKEVQDANKKLEAARAALHTGDVGVRINGADCAAAASSSDLPAASAAPGLVDGTSGWLPAGVSESVFGLQYEINYDAAKISGLQEYVREVCR